MISLHDFLGVFLLGAACAICACIYMHVLSTEPILNWWFRFGSKFQYKDWPREIYDEWESKTVYARQFQTREDYYAHLKNERHHLGHRWHWKIIWGCEKCLSGQLAFWYYLFKTILSPLVGLSQPEPYNLAYHIFAVCAAVFSALLVMKLFQRLSIS